MADYISRKDRLYSKKTKKLLDEQTRAQLIYQKILDPSMEPTKEQTRAINGGWKKIVKYKRGVRVKTDEQKIVEGLKKLPKAKDLLVKAKCRRENYEISQAKEQRKKLDKIYNHLHGKRYKENNFGVIKRSKKKLNAEELHWPESPVKRKRFAMRNNGQYIYSRINYVKPTKALSQNHLHENKTLSVTSDLTQLTYFQNVPSIKMSRFGRLTNSSFAHPKKDYSISSKNRKYSSVDKSFIRVKEIKSTKNKKAKKNFHHALFKGKKANKRFVGAKLRFRNKMETEMMEKAKRKLLTRKKKKKKKAGKDKDLVVIAPYLKKDPLLKKLKRKKGKKRKIRSNSIGN